ncbi:MAG: LL-diaminopimelate aminotransferase [Lachnospiraceae bacterium]|nr:LL-diaminopimelate aminotransferase [Lachnospiraceae bacterium]
MSIKLNDNYARLGKNYLFAEIKNRVAAYQEAHPQADIIRLGIGDVTRPLPEIVTEAMAQAAREMATAAGFHGYGAEQGYDFLKEAVRDYYAKRGVSLSCEEIFISDGAKSDIGNLTDLFGQDNMVLIPDPVYPVYVDTNVMNGRKIIFLPAGEENGFLPMPGPETAGDIIYLCSPNNPTGAVYNKDQLQKWVDFANARGSIILFDAAYECFIQDELPHSIYEIPGAKTCAIEICSLSKKAGFTGTRCGYTVVPLALKRDGFSLNALWLRRQCTKYNGTSYVVQRGAQAVFTPEGEKAVEENLQYYRENARIITQALEKMGVYYTGGRNAPYIWLKCPAGQDSWAFFDRLLSECHVVGTPGAGFGNCGWEYLRLTAFGTRENTVEAIRRIKEGGIFR